MRATLALVLLAAAAGCSNLKTYPNDHDKNALVRVKNEGGGFFSKTRPDVHLYRVDAACQAKYLGTVELDRPTVEIGLPLNQSLLLEFVFSKSTFGGSESATAIEMMTTPRKGVRYEFEVAYLRNGYTATGVELQQGRRREVEHRRLRDCMSDRRRSPA